jgi:hypothetical protein
MHQRIRQLTCSTAAKEKKGMILPPNSPSAAAAASTARRGCCSSPRSGDGIHDVSISGQVFVDPILGIIR